MTFPWKKVKSSGLFSRLVADLHQPPRRGGTLVVETGFPTSLIDLIVKNRDRLRKSPKSKSTPQTQTQIHTTTSTTTQLPCNNENNQSPQIDVAKLVLVESEWRGMFPFRAAFKLVVVVALAVSTRKVALWIMIAAFFLLVIEFIIGSSVFGLLRSKSHAIFPDSLTGKGSSEQATVVPDTSNTEDNCIVEEIQIAESESEVEEDEEMETRIRRKDEQQQHGESESGSGRIRRRHLIKKLVPKKLLRHGRRRRKKKGEEKSENDDDRCAWEAGEIYKEEEEEEIEEEDESQEGCEQVSWSGGGLMGVIVIVIVVAGVVVGGRGIGLLVTLVWLLMVTYVKERFQMLKI